MNHVTISMQKNYIFSVSILWDVDWIRDHRGAHCDSKGVAVWDFIVYNGLNVDGLQLEVNGDIDQPGEERDMLRIQCAEFTSQRKVMPFNTKTHKQTESNLWNKRVKFLWNSLFPAAVLYVSGSSPMQSGKRKIRNSKRGTKSYMIFSISHECHTTVYFYHYIYHALAIAICQISRCVQITPFPGPDTVFCY